MKLTPIITEQNQRFFVQDLKSSVAGTELFTAPLAVDVPVDIISLSSPGWILRSAVFDMRDGLDPTDLAIKSIALRHSLSGRKIDVVLDKPLVATPSESGDMQYMTLCGTVQLITPELRGIHVSVIGTVNVETAECRVQAKLDHARMLQDPLNINITCGEMIGWGVIGYTLNVNLSKEDVVAA